MSELNQPSSPVRPPTKKGSSKATYILLGLTALGGLIFVGSMAAVVTLVMQDDAGEVAEGSLLEVRLAGQITDAPRPGGLFDEPDDLPLSVTDISAAIRAAAVDDRITGLYLDLRSPSVGWAGSQEIRQSIEVFRAEGKPCVAYSEVWTTGSYYLGSVCDHVVMPPSGIAMVTGLEANTTYYVGTLDKLGITVEMEHVGDFKSAVEPYERSGPSEPAAEAMNYLLDGLWGSFLSDVGAGRGLTADEVQELVDRPSLSPEAAMARGLVDALAFPDVLRDTAPKMADDGWRELLAEANEAPPTGDQDTESEDYTSIKEYIKGVRSEWKSHDNQIAVVYAEGPIVAGESEGGLFGDARLADQTFRHWMEEVREDDEVKAVVLRVNSPGGSGAASDMMWREVQRTQNAGKPVVVSMANYAASGGYYIAAPADWIVAHPNTLTGSIGVFGGKMNLSGAYEKLGMTQHSYKRGKESDLFSATAPFSEEGRAAYRTFLHDFYEKFLSRVGSGRGMARDEVHKVAQGRVWTGTQALERGLVDELGGLDVAVEKAAELAKLDDYGLRKWPIQKSFIELLVEDMEQASTPTLQVDLGPMVDEGVLQDLSLLQSILEVGPAAIIPGHLEVE